MTKTTNMDPIKMYEGSTNIAPASFTPRKLTNVKSAIIDKVRGTLYEVRSGKAEIIAATPAAD